MSEENKSIFSKLGEAVEVALDGYLAKAKSSIKQGNEEAAWDRRSIIELDYATEQQSGWVEKRGMVGPEVLKSMSRKDSVILSIRKTRLAQISLFTKPQRDKYSPGWIIDPKEPVDISEEDKAKLSELEINDTDPEAEKQLRIEIEQKRAKALKQQKKEIEEIQRFIKHCGMPEDMANSRKKRMDFPKFVNLIVDDRLVYNYAAIETIPTKVTQNDEIPKLSHFYPVSAGTIRFITKASQERFKEFAKQQMLKEGKKYEGDEKPYEYVQVIRGRVQAAYTEDQLIYEPASPSVDPEDLGYAPGELEQLINIVTAHLYAEAHNRNFFTQGIGTKGILHIKGDNINRAQLEAFKRQWFNQVVNSRNAFRPPIIGIADDVKWVELAQSNKDMEFDNWMHYLIRICCAVYQIDPAEINFDISKVNTSTLNETSNEARIKNSRDKGLKPLLDYIENIINNDILRRWNPKLADKYEFRFVGLDAETREQEYKRLKEETQIWKTVNEARVEQGKAPIEHGDIILAATYTQYLGQVQQQEAMDQQAGQPDPQAQEDAQAEEAQAVGGDNQAFDQQLGSENDQYLSQIEKEMNDIEAGAKQEEADKKKKEEMKAKEAAKKSLEPTKIEYYNLEKSSDDEE
jgi:Phage portal protein